MCFYLVDLEPIAEPDARPVVEPDFLDGLGERVLKGLVALVAIPLLARVGTRVW